MMDVADQAQRPRPLSIPQLLVADLFGKVLDRTDRAVVTKGFVCIRTDFCGATFTPRSGSASARAGGVRFSQVISDSVVCPVSAQART